MPNSNHYVLCPYYENEKNESISCEDVIRTFPNLKKKEWYMKTYCDANWQECIFADAMNRAYEEGEEALEKEKIKALEKELRSMGIKYGREKKKNERQQKKIDELMAVNQSFTSVNNKLEKQRKELYKELRETKEELEKVNKKIYAELQQLTEVYEIRMAYLIEKSGEVLHEEDVKEWAEGYEIALTVDDENVMNRAWKVVKREVEEDDKDGFHTETEKE